MAIHSKCGSDDHGVPITITAEARGIKLKAIAQPLRVALTGRTVSPGIDEIMITLGRDKTRSRIREAIAFIGRT